MDDTNEYTVMVVVTQPDRTRVERCLKLHIDEPDNEEKQKHLIDGLQIIGENLADFMFPIYRPSQVEVVQRHLWELRRDRK